MLDEFCVTAGYNRKYAIRLLNGVPPKRQRGKWPTGREPPYGKQVISILTTLWEAAGYPWSVRLKALLPSSGWQRSRAWICVFSSAHNTKTLSGGWR